jgi:hypothetical protein
MKRKFILGDKPLTIATELPQSAYSQQPPVVATPPRRQWQFSLRTLLLLMAVAGVWLAHYVNRQQIPMLRQRIGMLRPIARELQVKNDNWLAVIKAEPLWKDDHQWDVYVPRDGFELALTLEQLQEENFPAPLHTVPLPAGRVRVALEYLDNHHTGFSLRVILDRREVIAVEKPPGWTANHQGIGPNKFRESQQVPPDEPAVLYRRWGTNKAGAGALLWIRSMPPE